MGDSRGAGHNNFYPRPPRGGRRCNSVRIREVGGISIHALREEGDFAELPVVAAKVISIHALREEGDLREGLALGQLDISIHALREEGDLSSWPIRALAVSFLSTPSARRAT